MVLCVCTMTAFSLMCSSFRCVKLVLPLVTLQWVEDGEEVQKSQGDGSPCEQSEAPRHTQQEGEADDAAQVS